MALESHGLDGGLSTGANKFALAFVTCRSLHIPFVGKFNLCLNLAEKRNPHVAENLIHMRLLVDFFFLPGHHRVIKATYFLITISY